MAVAALAFGTIALGGSNRAEAALRLTVSAGGPAVVFTDSGNGLTTGFFNIDGYTLNIETVTTNFPGAPNGGSLTTTANFATTTGPVQNLSILAEVVNSTFTSLATFTSPSGANLTLTSNATGVGGTATSGVLDFSSTANGVTVAVNNVSIPGLIDARNSASFPGPGGYTLTNSFLISGVSINSAGFGITGASTVAAAPEPGTMALALIAVGFVGVNQIRRRLRAVA